MYPHERSLVKRLANQPFVLIGINSDPKTRLRTAMKKNNITWRSFWDGGNTRGPIATAWGVRGWPTIYVLDDRGVIRYKNVRGAKMDTAVDTLLAKTTTSLTENLSSVKPEERGMAAYYLGSAGVKGAKSAITNLLEDADPVVRQRAATGLALLGDKTDPLVELLRKATSDKNPSVQVASLQALGRSGDAGSAGVIVKALSSKNTEVLVAAIGGAGELKATPAVDTLKTLTSHKDTAVSHAAIASLGLVGGKAGTAALKELAAQPKHPGRVRIAAALFQSGDKASGDAFKAFLSDETVSVRREAIAALASLKGLETQPLYVKALADKDAEVRNVARKVLGKSKDPKIQKALKDVLALEVDDLLPKLRNRQTVMAASQSLVALGADVAPLLMERLATEKTAAGQDGIGRTLFGMRSNKSVTGVVKAGLKSEVRVVRGWSAFLLQFNGPDPALLPTLAEFAASDFELLNAHSARALGRYKQKQATAALAAVLKKKQPGAANTRLISTAISSLQRQDTPAAAEALGALLDNPKLRRQVEAALKRMKTPAAKKFLKSTPPSSTPKPSVGSATIKDAQAAKKAAETFVDLSQSGLGLQGVGKALGKRTETKATEVRVHTAGGKRLPSRFGPPLGKKNALLVKFRSAKANVIVVVMTKKANGKYGWRDVLSLPKSDFEKLPKLLPASEGKAKSPVRAKKLRTR